MQITDSDSSLQLTHINSEIPTPKSPKPPVFSAETERAGAIRGYNLRIFLGRLAICHILGGEGGGGFGDIL
jgi:hypothetical protein